MTKRKIAFEKLNSINDFILAPTNSLKVVKDAHKKSRVVQKAAKLRNENIYLFCPQLSQFLNSHSKFTFTGEL